MPPCSCSLSENLNSKKGAPRKKFGLVRRIRKYRTGWLHGPVQLPSWLAMTRSRSLILGSFALVRARNNQELWKTLTSPVTCRGRPDGVGFVAREEGAIDLHTKW